MATELAGQLDLLPQVAEQVNTRSARREFGVTDAIADLKRAIRNKTAGASLAVMERPAAWLDQVTVSAFPSGGEWTVTSLPVELSPEGRSDLGWGVLRLVGEAGYAAEVKWVKPSSAYFFDATALLSELTGTMAYEHRGIDLWPGATQLVGEVSPVPVTVRTVNLSPLETLTRARSAVREAQGDALADLRQRLDNAMAMFAQQAPRDVVAYLADEVGVGQLLTAKAIGVSPTAVRKWKRGEPARSEHRSRLSVFAALTKLLAELGPYDPAGWLDMPISIESTLSPIDLFLAGRSDLVLLRAANQASPQETLDAFDRRWREAYAPDRDYEIVTLSDGNRSAVPRKRSDQ